MKLKVNAVLPEPSARRLALPDTQRLSHFFFRNAPIQQFTPRVFRENDGAVKFHRLPLCCLTFYPCWGGQPLNRRTLR